MFNSVVNEFMYDYLQTKYREHEYKIKQQVLLEQQLLTYKITKEDINKLANIKKPILNWNCQILL